MSFSRAQCLTPHSPLPAASRKSPVRRPLPQEGAAASQMVSELFFAHTRSSTLPSASALFLGQVCRKSAHGHWSETSWVRMPTGNPYSLAVRKPPPGPRRSLYA